MHLSDHDLTLLAQYAIDAALKAGQVLQTYSPTNLTVNRKAQASSLASAVVTEADLKSQEIIVDALRPSMETYDLALLSEESPDDHSRFMKDYFWCIDPIDGTLPFTEGKNGYAVSIALVSKAGKSVIGVVHNPPTNKIWHAISGQGAFINETGIDLATIEDDGSSIQYFVDRSFLDDPRFEDTKAMLESYDQRLLPKSTSLDYVGGAVMQAMTALNYSRGCYFKYPKVDNSGGSIWDYAATNCIYRELKLFATDIHGDPMDLNRTASTFMNHRGIIYATNRDLIKSVRSVYRDIQK
ncbi:MAG: inositol monophosphatase [Saprospiraceae bacterium]|nr:inositol monophosphatase [Saprospiraceae bacterium]